LKIYEGMDLNNRGGGAWIIIQDYCVLLNSKI
jgi:hypothetical protein